MVPPRWPDKNSRPMPTYPCSRCGREVASRFKGLRVERFLAQSRTRSAIGRHRLGGWPTKF